MLGDPIFWDTLVRTVVFTVANVGLTMVLGLAIALLLVRLSTPVRILLTAGLVLVWAMPAVVAVQVWYWMTNFQNGVLNHVLTSLHVGDFFQHDWYATTFSKLAMVTLLIVWGRCRSSQSRCTPGSRRCRASSSRQPRSTARASWRAFRDVTFPVLKPILLILTSLSIIWDFGVFRSRTC